MLDPALRTLKDRLLFPLARRVPSAIHPHLISLVGFAVGVGSGWSLLQHAYGAALGLWWLNRLLDGLDGAVARIQRRQSDFGGYLDLLLDFVLYALLPICLVLAAPRPEDHLFALAGLLASFYVNAASWMYLSALLEKRALGAAARGEVTSITMPIGLIEGTETVLFFSCFMLFPQALDSLFVGMAALVLLTVAQRMLWAMRHL